MTLTSLAPKYSMAKNPPYQIDCSFGASGKKVAATKRRIRFRFGFSDARALAEGSTGTNCRGEEHEVTLIWSLTSGKRRVMADGVEVHFSKGPRAETKFETSWTMNGQHTIKLIAHAAPPLRPTPGFRQFDLLLDGLSYFDMPKIYELGVKANRMVPASDASRSFARPAYNNYNLSPEYERSSYAHPAPKREAKQIQSPTSVIGQTDASPPPQDLISETTPTQGVDDFFASPVYDAPPAPALINDEFAPVEPTEQPRSTAVVHNEILNAYGPPQAANPELLALTYGEQAPPAYAATLNAPSNVSPTYQYQTTPPQAYNAPPPVPSPQCTEVAHVEPTVVTPSAPQQLTMTQLMDAPIEEEPVNEMERALKNLVNIDDIATETTAPEKKKLNEKREAKLNKGKSKPLPPTEPSWHLGLKPALSDIKANAPARKEPSKEIMRTHAFDPRAAQAGMMVIYGVPQISSPGFGVPVQMQQQQQYYMYAQQNHTLHQQMYAAY